MILTVKKFFEPFMKKLRKTKQTEFRVEKVKKKRDDKLHKVIKLYDIR